MRINLLLPAFCIIIINLISKIKSGEFEGLEESKKNHIILVMKSERNKIEKSLDKNFEEMGFDKKKKPLIYSLCIDYLDINMFLFNTEPQHDMVIKSILKAELLNNYSYKSGSRKTKDKKSVSYLNQEPWSLSLSREYSKVFIKDAVSTGDAKVQNLRAIFLSLILDHQLEKSEFLDIIQILREMWELSLDRMNDIKYDITFRNGNETSDDGRTKIPPLSEEKMKEFADYFYKEIVSSSSSFKAYCTKTFNTDAFLSDYAKFCPEYVNGLFLNSLNEGNTFTQFSYALHVLTKIFRNLLITKMKYLDEYKKVEYMKNHTQVNELYKKIIKDANTLTNSFKGKLQKYFVNDIYSKVDTLEINEKDKEIEKKKMVKNLHENIEVLVFTFLSWIDKPWIRDEIIQILEKHKAKTIDIMVDRRLPKEELSSIFHLIYDSLNNQTVVYPEKDKWKVYPSLNPYIKVYKTEKYDYSPKDEIGD